MTVYAYRAWRVFDGPHLQPVSFIRTNMWRPREVSVAECASPRPCSPQCSMCYKHNEIPGTGCGCGLWGSLIASIPLTYIHDQNQVLGVVELWGRIVRHTHGYRGQFGRPVALVSYPGQDLNELSAVYDLPVLPSIEATNAEFKLGGGMVVPNPSRHRAQPHFDWFKVLEFP